MQRIQYRPLPIGFNPQNPQIKKNNKKRKNKRMKNILNKKFGKNNRPRRLRIMYGQQQDLSFGQQRNFKGMGNTFTTPVSESKNIQSYFKFSNDVITFCQPIPTINYTGNLAVIPLHPFLFSGRTATIASSFLNYQITRAVVHYVPLIGSTSTGMIAMTSTQNCNPITNTTASQFGQMTIINAEISPVWMCSKYFVKDLDKTPKMLDVVNRKDIPNNIYVAGSGLAGNLNASCTLFIEMSIKLLRPAPQITYVGTFTAIYTLAVGGTRISSIMSNSQTGIVIASTVPNIDVGEMIKAPPFTAAATDYDINLFHNDVQTNYLDANDQGTLTVIFFTTN